MFYFLVIAQMQLPKEVSYDNPLFFTKNLQQMVQTTSNVKGKKMPNLFHDNLLHQEIKRKISIACVPNKYYFNPLTLAVSFLFFLFVLDNI